MTRLLTAFALCAAAGGIARAQSERGDESPRPVEPSSPGPLPPLASVEPWLELSADGRWDDYLPGGAQGFVARIAPGAGVRLHTPRLVLRMEGVAAYDRYEATQAALPDSWNVHALAQADYRATRRLMLHAGDKFTDARDPREIDRIGVVTPPGVQITDNVATANGEFAATRRISVDAGYAYRFTRFGDVHGMPTPGGDEHDVAGGASLKVTANDIFRTGWRTQFFVAGVSAQAHTPTAGWHHKLSRAAWVEAEGGPMFYDSPSIDRGDESPHPSSGGTAVTWHAKAALLADWPHLRVMLDYDRDFVGGTGAAPVIWANFVAGTVRFRPLRWLDLQMRADYFRNGLAPDQAMLVDGYDFWGELVVRVGRNLELGGYYSYRQQFDHAMAGVFGFRRDLVGIRLTAILAPSPRMTQEVQ